MAEEISTAQVMQKLALSLKSIKDELKNWHDESKKNQVSIAALNKRLDMFSQKTSVSPDVKKELDKLNGQVQKMGGVGPEAKSALEQKLLALESDITQINDLQSRITQLSSSSTMGDQKIEKEIEALKKEVDAIPRETPSTSKEGNEFLNTLQTELKDWHKESMGNTKEITVLLKRLSELESKTEADEKVKADLERVMKNMDQVAGSIDKFTELKQTIVKYNEEFQDLYSVIGKDKVELDTLNNSILKLQSKLVEWGERNTENLEEISDIKQDLASIAKEIKTKDVTGKISAVSDSLDLVADRVESLQRQEHDLQNTQQQLLEFDKGLKELVRKAVLASLSRQEFEKEFSKLESGKSSKTVRTSSAKPRAKLAKPPKTSDVKSKMRQLREALEEENEEKHDVFNEFEKELNLADSETQKQMLWDNLVRDLNTPLKESVTKARVQIKLAKANGEDVSKLNLLVAKADIGMVSLETSAALKNLPKTKEIIAKLVDLKTKIDSQLT